QALVGAGRPGQDPPLRRLGPGERATPAGPRTRSAPRPDQARGLPRAAAARPAYSIRPRPAAGTHAQLRLALRGTPGATDRLGGGWVPGSWRAPNDRRRADRPLKRPVRPVAVVPSRSGSTRCPPAGLPANKFRGVGPVPIGRDNTAQQKNRPDSAE